jgi:hypothetical protein
MFEKPIFATSLGFAVVLSFAAFAKHYDASRHRDLAADRAAALISNAREQRRQRRAG